MNLGQQKKLQKAIDNATTYAEWSDAAQAYDVWSGAERWRMMDQSRRYDYVSIRVRLDRLRSLRARHDNRGLLFTLNEGIHGNMGGMGNSKLYDRAKFGTKLLIQDYVDEVVDALLHLASPEVNDISFEEKLEFFRRAHHCFGCSALMLSGSGSLLYFHIGVVKALLEHDLLPNILSGASGGAFVSGVVCTHSNEDLKEMLSAEYLSSTVGQQEARRGLFKLPKRIRAHEVRGLLGKYLPDMTFQEAFEFTGRQLNVSVAPVEEHQTSRLLNAVTSPNVYIAESVFASSAIPGIFPPVTLSAKNDQGERQAYLPSRKWVDGSISDDLPAKRLARLYGVNHYIVSQTAPHVLPFVTDGKRDSGALAQIRYAGLQTARAWVNAGAELTRQPFLRSKVLSQLTNAVQSIINQDYIGDINILPPTKFFNPTKVLAHLSEKEIAELVLMGERSTWPKLEMVRVQTKVGGVLSSIVKDYEEVGLHETAENSKVING